jgi:hypothetical protein
VWAVLRAGLLEGRTVTVSGGAAGVGERLAQLGARVCEPGGEDRVSALVHDARADFAASGLDGAMQRAWDAVRAVAVGSLIPGAAGKVVLVAPGPDAGPHAEAVRAALENLARTLSIEWARYGITATAVAPGPDSSEQELADLVSFLVSRAGDYYSGCRFDLGLIRAS